MNFLAGGLLIFADEEYTFWLLVHIVDELLPEYFTETMTGCIVDRCVVCISCSAMLLAFLVV